MSPDRGSPTVFLHIGAFKTGTSYLQSVLWASRERLADDGVLFPGEKSWADQVFAVRDLLGMRTRGSRDVRIAGSWDRLVDGVRGWGGPAALVSMEYLSLATPRQARAAVRSLEPAEVHVVLTARDLARVTAAMWQEGVKSDQAWSWEEFIAAVRDPDRAAVAPARGFWMRQDLVAVLDAWESAVPRERVHLVTVPRPGAEPGLLVARFASVVGVDPGRLAADQPRTNESVGVAEAEVLRRLNVGLGGRLNQRQYERAVKRGVLRTLMARPVTARMQLPASDFGWASERASGMVGTLRQRGYDVAGDLDELIPCPDSGDGARRPDQVDASDVLAAAMDAMVALTEDLATAWWANKRPDRARESHISRSRLSSSVRGAQFQAKRAAVDLADRNRLAGKALRAYLRRRGRRRQTGPADVAP